MRIKSIRSATLPLRSVPTPLRAALPCGAATTQRCSIGLPSSKPKLFTDHLVHDGHRPLGERLNEISRSVGHLILARNVSVSKRSQIRISRNNSAEFASLPSCSVCLHPPHPFVASQVHRRRHRDLLRCHASWHRRREKSRESTFRTLWWPLSCGLQQPPSCGLVWRPWMYPGCQETQTLAPPVAS